MVDSTLSSLRSSWHAHAPAEYVLASCGSGAVAPSCALQAVQHGVIVASELRSYDTREWAASEVADSEDPIDAMFDELETPPDQCRVTYELGADYGFLSRIYYDCGQEGWGIDVVCFEADTLDLEACRASVH